MSERAEIQKIIEGALFVHAKPLSVSKLQEKVLYDFGISNSEVRGLLAEIGEKYKDSGVVLLDTAGGYHFVSNPDVNEHISRLFEDPPQRYSKAAMEVLGIIAYKEPITRPEIEEIRSVSMNPSIMKVLLESGWIKEVGRKEVPGNPKQFATTTKFLDDLQLKSRRDLPELLDIEYDDLWNDPQQLDLVEKLVEEEQGNDK